MLLQNERVLLEIADNSGALTRLADKSSGMAFIQTAPEAAFRVTVPDGPRRVKTLPSIAFSFTAKEDAAVRFSRLKMP